MAVYVDDGRRPYRTMIMCHMWADSLEELLEMAHKIPVKRHFVQGHPTLSRYRNAKWVHFDICMTSRKRAIHLGAIQVTSREAVEHRRRQNDPKHRALQLGRGRNDQQQSGS